MKADATAAAPPADEEFLVGAPPISLPKGGGAIRGIGEKFTTNPVTGTGSVSVPIHASAGRGGIGPHFALTYNTGGGNGPFGLGWSLPLQAITRKTDKGLPRYADDSDIFVWSGAEDIVPQLVENNGTWDRVESQRTLYGKPYRVRRYRPRIEGPFARIEQWSNIADAADMFWRSIARDNTTTWYGKDAESRIFDPADPSRIFAWLACELHDDKGDVVIFRYKAENDDGIAAGAVHERNRTTQARTAQRYLKRVLYGNRVPYYPDLDALAPVALPTDWCFELVFDYGDHAVADPLPDEPGKTWPVRLDPFSSYRATFEVRAYRLCRRVLMFHHFPGAAGVGQNCLVRSTDFTYAHDVAPADPRNPIYARLVAVRHTGYRRAAAGYVARSLPPLTFSYTEPAIDGTVVELERASLDNLPQGIDGAHYQWVDLDGEGVPGILSEHDGAWYYKRNVSPINPTSESGSDPPRARFTPMEEVRQRPSLAALARGGQQLLDLAGDGRLDLVQFDRPNPGFYARADSGEWAPFQPFRSLPSLDWKNPQLKFLDLTGDGLVDLLVTEDEALWWHQSLAEAGFSAAQRVPQALDEEKGPKLVFADGTESIFLADLSGDGLTDLVRVRNGEVCYWPNLGYGRFGAKVTTEDAPWFETPDQFDARRLRFADVDGSGTSDIVYFAGSGARIYFNRSGNGWSEATTLADFPPVDNTSSALVLDLLGNGTACLVWSSALPGRVEARMRYVDLMGGVKPHLLVKIDNNLGAETVIRYAPSTQFYLSDKLAGRPWITRLPFPVHVVTRVETVDHVSRNRFVTRYAYHHGYFDGDEREFRGFGQVEQWDTEEFAALNASADFPDATNIDAASHVPPVLTRSWFHTGLYLGRDRVSSFFAGLLDATDKGEYYREPGLTDAQAAALLLADTNLPPGLGVEDEREACRALKGSMLRQEIYALDGTAKEPHPYSVLEQNFTVACLQPRAANRYGVFLAHSRESISYHYERIPNDPRVGHSMTLEVDDYGNIRRGLAIGYGRRQPDAGLAAKDQDEQARTWITCRENSHTVPVDAADAYRAPLPSEQRVYEFTGFQPNARFTFDEWIKNDFDRIKTTPEIAYEAQADPAKMQKRLIKRSCTRYRTNDLTGLLPQDAMDSRALPGESYRLALTPGLLTQIFHRKIGADPDENLVANPVLLLGGIAGDAGGYVDLLGDGQWWAPSGKRYFDVNADSADPAVTAAVELASAKAHFFVPCKFVDPFGHAGTAQYDADDLLMVGTTDALGNTTAVDNDYRTLLPRSVTDVNGNRTRVAFDALGIAAAIAVGGKSGETVGDQLAGFDSDPSQVDLDALFDAADPRTTAPGLLGQATTRFVYDVDRFRRTRAAHPDDPAQWRPPQGATLARETHVGDLAPGEQSRIAVSFNYSDGFGRIVQQKIQAEPGPLSDGGPDLPIRWVGSGWTVFDNKGHPVRKYEPFFTATHGFEFAAVVGVSPILFHDPAGRTVATLHPDHSWEKVAFGAWRQDSWDAGDTLLVDPKNDIDVGDYFRRLPDADYLPGWYDQRIGGALGPREQDAAVKSAVHAGTPQAAHFDSLGRTFLTIAHNKAKHSGMPPGDPPIEEFHEARTELDIEGRRRAARDAQDRVVMRFDYDMLDRRLRQDSMDGGARWSLADIAGKPIRGWDMRGHIMRTVYDALRRGIETYVRTGGAELLAVRTEHGESQPNPEAANLRGRIFRIFDQAGTVTTDSYDFKGNVLRSKRQLAATYRTVLDWSAAPPLEPAVHLSLTRYDALNRAVEVTAPDGTVLRPVYNEANLLERVDGNLQGAAATTIFVDDIDYNAKGQRTFISYGNGTQTSYSYDPSTFNLMHLVTTRPAFPVDQRTVQELSYSYDPVANITSIRDEAWQPIYFRNKRVEPSTDYTYDAIGRLIEARGREHLGLGQPPSAPTAFDQVHVGIVHRGDGNALGTYVERYLYDNVGNILSMQHRGTDPLHPGWTRTHVYDETSLIEPARKNNRLSSSALDPAAVEPCFYDVHGNITAMSHLPLMVWDHQDQLQASARQVVGNGTPETTYYVYDASGQRVRKVTERQAAAGDQPTRASERIYIGGFEIYREYAPDGAATLARESVHVMDDKRRVALVETRTAGSDGSLPQLVRYQYGNQLGSALLELDAAAAIISYEEYYPYGATSYQAVRNVTETPKRYRFSAKERDEENGFYYHGARYYAPWLGRWTRVDPIGVGDGMNVYAYVSGDPIRLGDKTGTAGGDPKILLDETAPAGDRTFYHSIGTFRYGFLVGSDMAQIQQEGFRPSTGDSAKYGQGIYGFAAEEPAKGLAGASRPYVSFKVDPATPVREITVQRPTDIATYVIVAPDSKTNLKPTALEFHNVSPEQADAYHAGLKGTPPVTLNMRDTGTPPTNTGAPPQSPPAAPDAPKGGPPPASAVAAEEGSVTVSTAPKPPVGGGGVPKAGGGVPKSGGVAPRGGGPKGTGLAPKSGAPPSGGGGGMRPPPGAGFINTAGTTAANVVRGVVPGVVEAEIALGYGAVTAHAAGYTAVGAGLESAAAAVPVVGGALVVGAVGGNLAESTARSFGASEENSQNAGLLGAALTGAAVGALIGAPVGGVGAGPGAVIGAVAGMGGYLLSKYL